MEKLDSHNRQRLCARWVDRAIRRYLPAALEVAQKRRAAMSLRALTPVRDPRSARLAERTVMRIYIEICGQNPDHALAPVMQATLMALTRFSVPGPLDAAVATAIARDAARAAGVTSPSVWRLQTAEVEDLLAPPPRALNDAPKEMAA
jgi:hypothetical protein